MSEHEHTPPIKRTGAKWLSPGKVNVIIRGEEHVLPWEEAMDLAQGITEVLQLEVRP
ncbi:MAG: hypothetical protein V3573_14580 [Desulfovibrionaceae bacterium]